MQLDSDSLARLVPDELPDDEVTGLATLRLHLERYELAASLLCGRRALDIACGAGYGSAALAATAGVEVVGVDLSADAIAYAKQRYGRSNLQFLVGDALTFHDAGGFDTIVSLETIEHLPSAEPFVDRLACMMRPGATLIASVPTTPSVDLNPHHLQDFTERSFRRLFSRHGLIEVASLRQSQRVHLHQVLRRKERRMRDLRRNLGRYYLQHPEAFLRRVFALLRYGLTNRYLTVAWRRAEAP